MAKRNALGKGLGALIDTVEENEQGSSLGNIGGVAEIDIDSIDTNPYQPRTIFDEESLNELATSIKELGIIQPITVRIGNDDRFQLISGERRLKAAKIAGLVQIPAYVRSTENDNMLELALVENIQREDLDAIEIAISYQRLIDECELTQEALSQRVGKKRATVTNYIRLLKLPAEIQLGIKDHKVTMGHARALVNIEDPKDQLEIFNKIIEGDLSVRKAEDLVRKLNNGKLKSTSESPKNESVIKDYEALKSHLSRFFNANVQFNINNNGAGKIVIPFKSNDELERLIAIFDKLNT